ncbi:MAG: oligosaccharide flippase family protein [Bacteroidota bacterium]
MKNIFNTAKAKYFNRSEFFKNVTKLSAGSIFAQAIPIAVTPVLTRLYTPDEFAQFAFIMAIVSAVVVIATARYELAIMLPKNDDDAINIVALCFRILFFVTAFSLIGVFIYCYFFQEQLATQKIPASFLFFIPFMVLLLGTYQICNNWANRKKKYNQIIVSRISNTVATSSSNLALGFTGLTSIGLLLGTLFGQMTGAVMLFSQQFKSSKFLFPEIRREKIRALQKQYSHLPKVNMLQAIVDMLQINGVVYLLLFFFTSNIVGLYSLTIRLMQVPVSLVGSAITQVFFQQASSSYHENKNLQALVRRTILQAALLAAPVLIVLVFFGPDLFAFVFGEKWRESGEYARLLAPWIFCDFIRSPISQIPIIINKQRTLFLFSIFGNLILVIAFYIGSKYFHDVRMAFLILSSLLSLLFMIIIFWIYRTTKNTSASVL